MPATRRRDPGGPCASGCDQRGGRRECHSVAASYAWANARMRGSASGGPPMRMPIGRPDREKPQGRESEGQPPRLNVNVQVSSANGSVASRTSRGSPGRVGRTTRSTAANASGIASRYRSRAWRSRSDSAAEIASPSRMTLACSRVVQLGRPGQAGGVKGVRLGRDQVSEVGHGQIDVPHGGDERTKHHDGSVERRLNLGDDRRVAQGWVGADHAHAKPGYGGRSLRVECPRHPVIRHRAKHQGGVRDIAAQGPHVIEGRGDRNGAPRADDAVGRLQADDAAAGRGNSNRASGVRPYRPQAEAGGDGGSGAPGRTTRDPREIPRIAHRAEMADRRGRTQRELVHVELAEQDRARGLQLPNHLRVLRGHAVGRTPRSRPS